MSTDRLPDRWHSRDLPVLLEVARRLDDGESALQSGDLEETMTDRTTESIEASLDWLEDSSPPYVSGGRTPRRGGDTKGSVVVTGITERGRRAVGLWPSGEAAEALVDALRQAEAAVEDPEEKTILRRAAGAVGSVSRDVMVDVMAAVVARQSGLG